MSLGKRSLSYPREQLKPLFPLGTIMSPEEELKLPRGTNVFEILFSHNFCL
jgi:hypothetical protein